jgi:hypothetical protein
VTKNVLSTVSYIKQAEGQQRAHPSYASALHDIHA